MLTIQNITESSLNLIAPTVFIESVEKLDEQNYKILYSLEDKYTNGKFTWFDDEQVLNSVYVNFFVESPVDPVPLTTIKSKHQSIKKRPLENNTVYTFLNEIIIPIKTETAYLTASCGNEYLIGTKTIEPVIISGSIASSSYGTSSLSYINKNKDLSLLNITAELSSSVPSTVPITSDLFVSYTTNKRALFGFVFDLKAYLEQRSNTYKKLSSYQNYSTEILAKSSIPEQTVKFFKTNKTLQNSSEEALTNIVSVIKISDTDSKYLITSFDQSDSFYEYSLGVRLLVDDYADKIVDNTLLANLSSFLVLVRKYKDLFEQVTKNNLINPNEYIYVNEWDKISSELSGYIERISEVSAFYGGQQSFEQTKKYVSLFSSMLHPLTTRVALLNQLVEYIEKLSFYTQKLLSDTQLYNVSNLNSAKEYKNIFEKTFKDTIDFNYKKGYGYEVISTDSMTARMSQRDSGIKELPVAELELRRLLEANKYFGNPSVSTRQNINTFSISSLDAGAASYNLLTDIQSTNISLFNEVLYRVNEIASYNFAYPRLESQYYQLSADGITIDAVANSANTSVNNLQKSLLFDQNQDSRQSSLQTVTNTGLNGLYLALDENTYQQLETGSYQYTASANLSQGEASKFIITSQSLQAPELKSKHILYYNTLFSNKNIYGNESSNIQIYKLEELNVTPVIEQNLKFFNQYYYIRRRVGATQNTQQQFNLQNEINLGILPRFLNRNTTKQQFIVGIESI